MKVKFIRIADVILEELLSGKLNIKYSDPQLPDDIKVIDIQRDNMRSVWKFFIESQSFPDVIQPEELQIVCYAKRKDWLKAMHEKVLLS
jgi:hypothetical protein